MGNKRFIKDLKLTLTNLLKQIQLPCIGDRYLHMRRIVSQQGLPSALLRIVSSRSESRVEGKRVSARGLSQRAGAAESPARAAGQAPCQTLHSTRIEEIEHACWKSINNYCSYTRTKNIYTNEVLINEWISNSSKTVGINSVLYSGMKKMDKEKS